MSIGRESNLLIYILFYLENINNKNINFYLSIFILYI